MNTAWVRLLGFSESNDDWERSLNSWGGERCPRMVLLQLWRSKGPGRKAGRHFDPGDAGPVLKSPSNPICAGH